MRLIAAPLFASVAAMIAALAFAEVPPSRGADLVDKIVVGKSERKLYLLASGWVVRSYDIALGHKPVGRKLCRGDERTPEGSYVIERHVTNSHFHLALRISYPNFEDRRAAAIVGCDSGGDIMIHGLPDRYADMGRKHIEFNWTDGCIAVTNREIEEIFAKVADGTPIEIRD